MPFGAGLRSCIGSRFSQVEIKLGVARILRDFRLVPANNTTVNKIECLDENVIDVKRIGRPMESSVVSDVIMQQLYQ